MSDEESGSGEDVFILPKRQNIIYCGVCSAPPEFCEFNTPALYSDCLKWLSGHHPELLPEDTTLEKLLAGLGLEGGGKAKGGGAAAGGEEKQEKEKGGEEADEEEGKKKTKRGGLKPVKKKDASAGGKVYITRMSRNKRKSVTVVTGLDTYPDLKLKDVAKALGKQFACGSSVSDTAGGGKEIVIQGDVIDALADILVEKYSVPGDNLRLTA